MELISFIGDASKFISSYVVSLIIIINLGFIIIDIIPDLTLKGFIIYTIFLGSLIVSIALNISYYSDVPQDFFFLWNSPNTPIWNSCNSV